MNKLASILLIGALAFVLVPGGYAFATHTPTLTSSLNLSTTGTLTTGGDVTIQDNTPQILFDDADNAAIDTTITHNNGVLTIDANTNTVGTFVFTGTSGKILISGTGEEIATDVGTITLDPGDDGAEVIITTTGGLTIEDVITDSGAAVRIDDAADISGLLDVDTIISRTTNADLALSGDGSGGVDINDNAVIVGSLTISANNIITDTTTGMKIGTATNQKLGFFNAAPVVQQSALTTALTTASITSAQATDFVFQALTVTSPFGLADALEAETFVEIVINNQVRIAEIETVLSNLGLTA